MKIYTSLLFMLALFKLNGQTNLISNGSFERLNEEVFNRLNEASNFYDSHFGIEGSSLGEQGIFDCCWYSIGDISGNKQGIQGYTWVITPGLFYVASGDQPLPDHPYAIAGNEVNYTDPPRILETDATSYLKLNEHPSNETFGFDLSPPNSYFGENVNATNGTNYVALFDLENEKFKAKPIITSKLKYNLAKDVEYKFIIDYAKMNLLGYIKSQGNWNKVEDGKLKIWVCDDDYNHKQLIVSQLVSSNDWNTKEVVFKANRSSSRIIIEYNPILGSLNNKIGGVFIDNLKLFEACETAENQCNNANYRRDLLDVKLEKVKMTSPYVYPEPNSNDEGYMKTIRAFHLENVKRFEMKIYKPTYSVPSRTIDIWYPQSDYFWDGKDDNGEDLPDGDYRAVINAVSNDCFHITDADEKNFKLERKYSLFDVSISNGWEDGNAHISGLEKVKQLQVDVFAMGGQTPLYTLLYNDPRSNIRLSKESLEALPGNQTITIGQYTIRVTVRNNCNHESVFSKNAHIGNQIPGNTDPAYLALYDYASVPKGTFPCPYNFQYNQNVLSPMNCCEGDLYLSNMDIWNSWGTVNIEHYIHIGPNVVFENGTYNYLNAGDSIVFMPDQQTGVTVLGEAIFKPNTFECEICKNYVIETITDDEESEESDREIVMMSASDSMEIISKDMIVFPNPAMNNQEITLQAGDKRINPEQFKLVLSNSLGVEIPLRILLSSERKLVFKPTQLIAPGVYYLYFESDGEQRTFNVVIR